MDRERNASLPPRTPSPGLAARLGGLFVAALLLRAGIAAMTATMSADSAYYLWCAESFAVGNVDHALGSFSGIHPLYPAWIACLADLAGGYSAAGSVVSILSGSLVVIPLVLLVRSWWNERVAFWTGVLYAVEPTFALETADIMTTGLYLLLFLSALALYARALQGGRGWCLSLGGGLAAGLAYLTRPEGILLPVLFIAGAVVQAVRPGAVVRVAEPEGGATVRSGAVRLAGITLAALAAFGAVSGPYLMWMHSASGRWLVTLRPVHSGLKENVVRDESDGARAPIEVPEAQPGNAGSLEDVPGPAVPSRRPAQDPFFYSVVKHVGSRLVFPAFLPLLVVGLLAWRTQGGHPRCAVQLGTMTAILWLPAFIAGALYQYPLSHRYLLPGMLFVLPWMAAGVAGIVDALGPRPGSTWRHRLRVVLLAALLLSVGIKTLKPHRADEVAFVEAGRWVRFRASDRDACRVLAGREKLAYYAGGRLVRTPRWDDAAAAAGPVAYAGRLRRIHAASRADYLILDGRTMDVISPRFHEMLTDEGFDPVARFPQDGARAEGLIPVRIYRLP